ncbi:MAG: DNA polymerase III subunit delta [Oscillibacter sp.]|nr:DNA polymerase III subunit delta [Oscillibacter sp.]
MAYSKKKSGDEAALKKLKADLSAGTLGNAYLFHGEETYLRAYYLEKVRRTLVPPGFETFNSHTLEGKDLTVQALADMAEAMPMMAERTLIAVTDWDLFKLAEDQRNRLIALLEDLPPYCCIIFVYDILEYKPNRTLKKLWKALETYVETVAFQPLDNASLLDWIGREFRSRGKDVDRRTAEHLVFTCGSLMTGLVQEIEKAAAYAKGPAVTRKDIDAVAAPVLSAEVFRLSDAVLQGNHNQAAVILGDLLKMQTEPIQILGALGSQIRRLWAARTALDNGRDRFWLMELCGIKEYPAKLALSAARQTSAQWCAQAARQCQELDRRLKSQRGIDGPGELKLLLVRLAAERRRP